MKRWKALILASGLFMSVATVVPAGAITVFRPCVGNNTSAVCKATSEDEATSMIRRIIDLLMFGLGIISVILIIWGGVKYVTSRGDPANVKSAKDTVTYAVVGLVVALLAFAIVNFILTSFK